MIPSQKHENDEYEEPRQAGCFKQLLEAFCQQDRAERMRVEAMLGLDHIVRLLRPTFKAEYTRSRDDGRVRKIDTSSREHPLNGMPSHYSAVKDDHLCRSYVTYRVLECGGGRRGIRLEACFRVWKATQEFLLVDIT